MWVACTLCIISIYIYHLWVHCTDCKWVLLTIIESIPCRSLSLSQYIKMCIIFLFFSSITVSVDRLNSFCESPLTALSPLPFFKLEVFAHFRWYIFSVFSVHLIFLFYRLYMYFCFNLSLVIFFTTFAVVVVDITVVVVVDAYNTLSNVKPSRLLVTDGSIIFSFFSPSCTFNLTVISSSLTDRMCRRKKKMQLIAFERHNGGERWKNLEIKR